MFSGLCSVAVISKVFGNKGKGKALFFTDFVNNFGDDCPTFISSDELDEKLNIASKNCTPHFVLNF